MINLFNITFLRGLFKEVKFMVSKNNLNHKLESDATRVPHWGLRKLTVGVASVLLGTTLFFGINAYAATDAPAVTGQTTTSITTNSPLLALPLIVLLLQVQLLASLLQLQTN